jgi:hypothetical protein
MGARALHRYFCDVNSAAHEKKILESIQQVSYCTECLEDYLSYSLIPFGNTWKFLCWKCYRKALRQIRQEVVAKRDKNTSQQANE